MPPGDSRLDGKGALVTGDGTALARGMALAPAWAGADVALAGRRREPLEEAAADNITGITRTADGGYLAVGHQVG